MATDKGITVYVNPNYDGNPVTLFAGSYRLGDLLKSGVINDSISSIQVPPGYKVKAYEHNFSGAEATYTADTPYVGDKMNDLISSIEVTYDAEEAKKQPSPIDHEWGLEKLGDFDVTLPEGQTWPSGTPSRPKSVLLTGATEFFIPIAVPEIFVRFDLKSINVIQGLYICHWYYTIIDEIQVGVHFDDKYAGQTLQFPKMSSDGWKWFDGKQMVHCNEIQTIVIPKVAARYVMIRLKSRKGHGYNGSWGLRHIKISKPKAS